ncbi:hypothetical protein CEUSTIGMA_g13457.t1 [Chlamydomonas eustigma]|uniref:Sugar phosphate transporter domain-containing protein n=1 Tax=Chlamydomonas eustigma TaxID=1157962 RepID=A0A250XSZ6_9CHLO|nr:hypothetical protein CEUSTIGMA_g13457.t1 [Chlamydomonas eustigma]|eukprot:GAX86042.1 hypothetical protein CEUSTIGMA_g13457.t1 [Chlamydomonas eustigma]
MTDATSREASVLESTPDNIIPEDEARREALRQSGAAYLQKAMEQAIKGQDPFQIDSGGLKKERKRRQPKVDPEFVAFGLLLRDSLVYFYMALYVVCQASSYVLISVSFRSMQTPAVLTFLHMLSAAGGLYLASQYDVFDQPIQISAAALKGSSVQIVLYSTQMLCTFSALHHNSVNVVIVWITAGGAAIEAVVACWLNSTSLSQQSRIALITGFSAGVLELLFDPDKVPLGVLMLTLWSISKAVDCLWKQLRVDASLGDRLKVMWLVSRIRDIGDEEALHGDSTIAFMKNVVPAVPVLLLGFICMEGKELVDHELSVPAVELMLMACLAYALQLGCQLLLDQKAIKPEMQLGLKGASLLGAVIMFALEEHKTISLMAVLLSLASVTASLWAGWQQQRRESCSTITMLEKL